MIGSRIDKPSIDCARQFLRAFDDDSIRYWIDSTNAWNDRKRPGGRLWRAVDDLRKAWYHDGSQRGRARCKAAAEYLRTVIGELP
jgi:hypothetical protein